MSKKNKPAPAPAEKKTKEQEVGEALQKQMVARMKRANEKIDEILKEEACKIIVSRLPFDNGDVFIAQICPVEVQKNMLEINVTPVEQAAGKKAAEAGGLAESNE